MHAQRMQPGPTLVTDGAAQRWPPDRAVFRPPSRAQRSAVAMQTNRAVPGEAMASTARSERMRSLRSACKLIRCVGGVVV